MRPTMRQSLRRLGATSIAACVVVPLVHAQVGLDRLTTTRNGTVRFSYTARPDVCGNGRSVNIGRSNREWEAWCEHGPVRMSVTFVDGEVTGARTYVGGRWRETDGTDLGTVSAIAAARALLALADRGEGGGDDLVQGAALADSAVIWPDLLRLARNDRIPSRTRKSAVFWVSQAAGEEVSRGLAELARDEREDQSVREHAVFALSQLSDHRGIPVLVEIARTDRDPAIRRKAMFWLGQSDDPRALALFEEVLLGPNRRP